MDEREFETLFRALQAQLLRIARAQLGTHAAEDVVSETMTTLWRKPIRSPDGGSGADSFFGLARSVLTGHIRNELRACRRRAALVNQLTAQVAVASPRAPQPDNAEAGGGLDAWLERLPLADRQVLVLVDAGFDVPDIARILGCSCAAASKRRTRARERLRVLMSTSDPAGAAPDELAGTRG